jgi:hypothetical protein
MSATLGFRELASRLARLLNEMVRRGEVSERRLARLTGYSQPHVHNVLKGARGMNADFADSALDRLGISLLSLFTEQELGGLAGARAGNGVPVPLMDGTLGGGRPYPRLGMNSGTIQMASDVAEAFPFCAAAVVDALEDAMAPLIHPGDTLLLDRSPQVRGNPVFENVYAVCWRGRGYLGRCRLVGDALYVATDKPEPQHAISRPLRIGRGGVLNVVRGRVAWVGHPLPGE